MGNNFSRNESHNIYRTYDSRFIATQPAKKTGALASSLKKEVDIDENVSAKLKFFLSGTFYGKLRQKILIKELMKAEDFKDGCFELLVELKREIEDNNEHSSLSGLVTSNLINIIKEILDYVNENILKKKYSFDQNETKVKTLMFCIFKKLIELFHILKFLKEDGLFLEGKWWNPLSDQKKLENLQKKVHIMVDKFITHENLEEEEEEEEEEQEAEEDEEENENKDEVPPLPLAPHSLTSSTGHAALSPPPPHPNFSIPLSSSLPFVHSHHPISPKSPNSSSHSHLSSPLPILFSPTAPPHLSSLFPPLPSTSSAPPLSSSSPPSPPKDKNNSPRKKSVFNQARKDSVKLDSESLQKSAGYEEGAKKEDENGRKEEENSRKGDCGKKMSFSFETVDMKKSDSAQLIFRKNIEIWANETSQSLNELLELFQARKIALKLGDDELFTNENEILTEFENKLLFFKKEFSSISERNLGATENNEVLEGLFKEFTSFKESILKNYEEKINQREEENLSLNESAISSSAIRKSLDELKKSIQIEKNSILNPIELKKSIDSLRESLRESVELLNFQSIVRRVE